VTPPPGTAGAASPALTPGADPQRALQVTAIACAVAAVIAVVVCIVLSQPLAGVAAGVGLLLGAGNGLLAQRLLAFGVPMVATSLMRLLALTLVAVASGVFLGWQRIVLVVAGIAVAQLLLSAAALREVLRHR
jgi:hypothetical protein